MYWDDQEKLNEYLRTLSHVEYRQYKCRYGKGGARKTGNNGKKDFGVGYVKGLEHFEEIVKKDLLNSILANFETAKLDSFSSIELENMR